MGRPDQTPSPRMNDNFNPLFHQQPAPEPPVQMIQTNQRYPNNGGMVIQPNHVPMVRPVQPTVNQPCGVPVAIVVYTQPSNWTSGLCDCMDDCGNALITCLFPFITFGQIAEVIDEGTSSCGASALFYCLICCLCGIPYFVPCVTCTFVYTCTYRIKLRSKFGLPETPAPDCITHCFCQYCALCQEYRELKKRGLDPAIGWIGNVQKQRLAQQQQMMVPPVGQRMI